MGSVSHTSTFSFPLRRALASRLLLMTSLPAVDGTLFALGAKGALATWPGVVLVGLTVIAGASSWVAARVEFGRASTVSDRAALALVALASTVLAALAAAAGAAVGARVALAWFPAAAGVALIVLAAELAGARPARVLGVPLSAVLVAAGAVAEVVLWTL